MSDQAPDTEFEIAIKRRKAVEWLLMNDMLVRKAAEISKLDPVYTILLGAQYGAVFESKISDVLPRMQVTREDKLGEVSGILYHASSTHRT